MTWYEYSANNHLGIISFSLLFIGIMMALAGSRDGFGLSIIPGYKTVTRFILIISLVASITTCSIESYPSTVTTTQNTVAFRSPWDLLGYYKAISDGIGPLSLDIMIKHNKCIIIPCGETLKVLTERRQPEHTEKIEYKGQSYHIVQDNSLIYK